jgi:site-specific recombinase XerD
MARPLTGSGLRSKECVWLQVNDLGVAQRQIIGRSEKAMKDRMRMIHEDDS